MNQEIKRRWVEALRSGKYKQGQNCLHDSGDGSFCCLGVLTDLYIKEHGKKWHKCRDRPCTQLAYEGSWGGLPPSVMRWADVDRRDLFIDHFELATWNDRGSTFSEIADLIEQHL